MVDETGTLTDETEVAVDENTTAAVGNASEDEHGTVTRFQNVTTEATTEATAAALTEDLGGGGASYAEMKTNMAKREGIFGGMKEDDVAKYFNEHWNIEEGHELTYPEVIKRLETGDEHGVGKNKNLSGRLGDHIGNAANQPTQAEAAAALTAQLNQAPADNTVAAIPVNSACENKVEKPKKKRGFRGKTGRVITWPFRKGAQAIRWTARAPFRAAGWTMKKGRQLGKRTVVTAGKTVWTALKLGWSVMILSPIAYVAGYSSWSKGLAARWANIKSPWTKKTLEKIKVKA